MGKRANADSGTKQRVLESACRLFAEKGYRDTTVQEICEQANANIAAVNYYFRDKETLYIEALRYACELASQAYPLDGGLPEAAPPEEHLRAHVEANVRRILSDGPSSYFPRMRVKEMAEPTAAHRTLMKEIMRPFREHLEGVLVELLGDDADVKLCRLCALSVFSQFLILGFGRASRARLFKARRKSRPPSVEDLIDHITRFSLAGIRAMREQIRKRPHA